MISPGSLVIFRGQIARVASCAEGKISLELESGEAKKVREKDVSLLHGASSTRIPPAMEGGDFVTAHAMLASDHEGKAPIPTTWRELAELVFGVYSPATAAACARYAAAGELFKIIDDVPCALSFEEIDHLRRKSEEKLQESERRASFIAALRAAIRKKGDTGLQSALKTTQEFSRYIADLESFALGSGERCLIGADAGIAETREAVHQALLDSGLWESSFNPWPTRAGCLLWPPRLSFPKSELPAYVAGRKDLRHLPSFAIDNAWSTDPDDAIAFDGEFVWVHIADPAAFIAPGSALDAEALSRGATLYLPEKIVPMFPEETVGLLGLGMEDSSPALSFGIRLSDEGAPVETIIAPSTVRVTRLSYEEADALLAGGDKNLTNLDSIADLRHAHRLANGAVDIDMPEVSMKVDGDEVRFLSVPSTRSSEIVREMMLLAGEAVARWAYERKLPFTYSSQEAPQFPKSLQRSDGEEKLLSIQYQRRKGMKASIVGTECLAHQGLGLSFYSQVTSPLRRYQDLLAHYQIRAWLAFGGDLGNKTARKDPNSPSESRAAPLSADEVSRRCILAGQGSSSTRQAERDSRLHWIAYFLSQNPEWEGEAKILDLREQDIWIIVPELGMETSLRTRRPLALDDTVTVKASRVSIALHDITFELA
ncbi:MAG TPA: RNB domain-containing ribonuclease [Rectinemataceae bacterium]|nr:RNB domain-containing ribonuclease [Rectinemataceae bacterium]